MLVVYLDGRHGLGVQLGVPEQQHGSKCRMTTKHWEQTKGAWCGEDTRQNGMHIVDQQESCRSLGNLGDTDFGRKGRNLKGLVALNIWQILGDSNAGGKHGHKARNKGHFGGPRKGNTECVLDSIIDTEIQQEPRTVAIVRPASNGFCLVRTGGTE